MKFCLVDGMLLFETFVTYFKVCVCVCLEGEKEEGEVGGGGQISRRGR